MNPQVRVDARHIPLHGVRRQQERPLDRFGSLQEVREAAEREYILKKLEETSGNVTRTAELLGLERSNLYRKMKTLGIGPRNKGQRAWCNDSCGHSPNGLRRRHLPAPVRRPG